jgi:hypothetical protein
MFESQYLVFYNCFGKLHELPQEGLFKKNLKIMRGQKKLPFFICNNPMIQTITEVNHE